MDLREAIARRRSVKSYDPDHEIGDGELTALFEQTVRSPSSFNLQHWRFIVVRDRERRRQLCELAWSQRQVAEASAVIVILGNLKAHRDAAEICADMPGPLREMIIPMISGAYQGKPEMQRDEAIRSGSLAAMTLMLAAQEMGYDTCPMIGFDPERVCQFLGMDENHIPVMIVTLGKAAAPGRETTRRPLSRAVHLETFDGPGLGEG